jgi:uncharacterized protein
MTLAPAARGRLFDDERTQDLVVPFLGFFEPGDPGFEPADDIEERLDQAATAISRAILVLRKLAKLRAADGFAANKGTVLGEVGRNEPCPCGSGTNYKVERFTFAGAAHSLVVGIPQHLGLWALLSRPVTARP